MLRQLIEENKPLFIVGTYNAMVARILEKVGFQAVAMSGYATSLNMLGMPDAGFLTMTEMVMNAKYINNAISVPLIADADTGFGNAINVRRTVAEFIQAGVASVHIEDQVAPKRCGHVAGRQIIPLDEAVGKFRAAHDVRMEMDPDFVLIARTDARGAHNGSVEEAIRRGNAYVEAGADVIFVEGPTSVEEIAAFCERIKAPILYNYTGVSPRLSLEELGKIGVSIVVIPGITMRVTAQSVYDIALRLKENGPLVEAEWSKDFEKHHPLGNFHDFSGFPEIRRLEEVYLPAQEQEKYRDSIGFQP
jgi:2-methylisocitrate lyase-like PEP mutase family enzyme